MDNLQIAQEINTRIGNSPVPFDSVYSIALAIYQELGGEGNDFDSVYSILLEILPLASETAHVIDDSSISLTKTWSSSKISSELADAGFRTEFVEELPATGDIHTIYFVPSSSALAGNTYDEFMWNDSASEWEQVGSTAIDLTDIINDASVLSNRTWSSLKINSELSTKQNVLNASNGIAIDASNNISVEGIQITNDPTNYKYNFATYYYDDDTNQLGVNTADGGCSNWAEGSKTTATSRWGGNHAEGYSSSATADYAAHAEGAFTVATGAASHVEGHGSIVDPNTASGQGSHAEGIYTSATGAASHAEGNGSSYKKNTASGVGSHAEGIATTAQNDAEHASGLNNKSHKNSNNRGDSGNTLFSIGCDSTSIVEQMVAQNALEVMQNADLYIKGLGGYQGTDTKVQNASIMTVQEVINSKADAYEVATNAEVDMLFVQQTTIE